MGQCALGQARLPRGAEPLKGEVAEAGPFGRSEKGPVNLFPAEPSESRKGT